MEQWADIRRRVLQGGVSMPRILRKTDLHWTTLEKILAHRQATGVPTEGVHTRAAWSVVGPSAGCRRSARRLANWAGATTRGCPGERSSSSGP
jgi:hypothetical protein